MAVITLRCRKVVYCPECHATVEFQINFMGEPKLGGASHFCAVSNRRETFLDGSLFSWS